MKNSYCANSPARGGFVMVWGRFMKKGAGKLYRTMNRFYCRQILEENLSLSIQQLGLGKNFVFMHDNDSSIG